jgi:hypothetical protein
MVSASVLFEQAGDLAERLARDERLLFAGDAGERLAELFDVREAVAVGGDHGHGLGLEHQQSAVERVARLLVGDGEDGLGDHVGERGRGDFEGAGGGELGDLREVGAGHADHLGVGAAGADLHPVVVHQLDGDVAIGQQLDVVVELARGDGAGAGLLDLGRATGAQRLVEVGGGDGERAVCASKRKFERMGMVVLRSTTDCAAVSSRSSSARETVISRLPVGAWKSG